MDVDVAMAAEPMASSSDAGDALGVLDALPDPTILCSAAGHVVHVNDAAASLSGHDAEALTGARLDCLLRDDEDLQAPIGRWRGTTPVEGTLRRADGTRIRVEVAGGSVHLDGGDHLILTVREIAPRRPAATQAWEAERRWATLVHDVNLAVVALDDQGRITVANPYLCRLLGYDLDELVGADWFSTALHADDVATVRGVFDGVIAGLGHTVERNRVVARDGRTRVLDWFNVGLRDDDAAPSGTLSIGVDRTDQLRAEHELRAVHDVTEILLADGDVTSALPAVVASARRLIDADTAALLTTTPDGTVRVVAVDGVDAGAWVAAAEHIGPGFDTALRALTDVATDLSAVPPLRAVRHHVAGFDQVLIARLPGHGGALVVANRRGRPPFSPTDATTVQTFAGHAGVALSRVRDVQTRHRLDVLTERERIGHDLHDTTIQRLFAIGMGLQAAIAHDDAEALLARADDAVRELDEVVSGIRATIFRLEHPELDGVTARLRGVVDESVAHLGFRPDLQLHGPVDTVVDDHLAPHLVAVTREALANVARHAEASRARVRLHVADDALTLRVTDDGRGYEPGRSGAGYGLRNIAKRAAELGGTVAFGEGELGGAEVIWTVPS